MKRKLIAFVMVVVLSFRSMACTQNKENYKKDESKIINIIEDRELYTIYVDTETGVMYLKTYNSGVCVMVNPDGSPKIWGDNNN